MIVLSRRAGESILIGEEIRVTVMSLHGDRIRVGIEAPAAAETPMRGAGNGSSPGITAGVREEEGAVTAPAAAGDRAAADGQAVEPTRESFHANLLQRLQRFRLGWQSVWRRFSSYRSRRARPETAQEPEIAPEDLFFG